MLEVEDWNDWFEGGLECIIWLWMGDKIFYCKGNDEWERQLDSASFDGARGSIENTRETTLKFDWRWGVSNRKESQEDS